MLYRRGNEWDIYPHKVRYIQHGEDIEQWALPNKEWWMDFADKWDHTEIIEFVKVDLSDEQLSRFEEIKSMPEDFMDAYADYVLNGTFPKEIPIAHPFMIVKMLKEREQLEKENTILKAQNQALADQSGFHTDVLTEIILAITP